MTRTCYLCCYTTDRLYGRQLYGLSMAVLVGQTHGPSTDPICYSDTASTQLLTVTFSQIPKAILIQPICSVRISVMHDGLKVSRIRFNRSAKPSDSAECYGEFWLCCAVLER